MLTFPLPTDVNYAYADRFGEGAGDHKGTDIFAAFGTPVLAVIAGAAHPATDPKGGTVVYLANEDGSQVYYYAHLSGLDPALEHADYTIVDVGDVLGYVGQSGNASATPPHLHIQAKVNGVLMDPYPLLTDVDPRPRSRPGGGTFPRTPKPRSGTPPIETEPGAPGEHGPFRHGGGTVLTPAEPPQSPTLWGIALLLGLWMAAKTIEPLFRRREHG